MIITEIRNVHYSEKMNYYDNIASGIIMYRMRSRAVLTKHKNTKTSLRSVYSSKTVLYYMRCT